LVGGLSPTSHKCKKKFKIDCYPLVVPKKGVEKSIQILKKLSFEKSKVKRWTIMYCIVSLNRD